MKTSSILFLSVCLLLASCQPENEKGDASGSTSAETLTVDGNTINQTRPDSPLLSMVTHYKIYPGDQEGTLLSQEKYNEEGRKFEMITYDFYGSGEEDGRSIYTYDNQGNLVEMFDGETTETMEYDDQNQLIKSTWSREGGQGATETHAYDEYGNETEVKYYTADGEYDYSRVIKREYDNQGHILKETKWEKYADGTPDIHMYAIAQEFDAKGQLVVKNMLRDDGTIYSQEKYYYDLAGNLIETREFEEEILMGREVNTVNEYGEAIKSQTFNDMETLQFTHTFEYDQYGNQTNMTYEHTDGDAWGERTEYTFPEGS